MLSFPWQANDAGYLEIGGYIQNKSPDFDQIQN